MFGSYLKVLDERMNLRSSQDQTHQVYVGAERLTTQILPASTRQDSTNIKFTVDPPSYTTVTDRCIKVRTYWEVEFKDDASWGDELSGPRQWPLHSCVENLSVQINQESTNDNVNRKLHAMLAFGTTPEDRNKIQSLTAAMPDQFQEYSDYVNYGSARNPLANYGENAVEMTRGALPTIYYPDEMNKKIIRFVVTEPLYISPFHDGSGGELSGFVRVDQFEIYIRLASNLSRVWSMNENDTNSILNVSFFQDPQCVLNFMTPQAVQPLPAMISLPYHKSNDYMRQSPVLNPGEQTTINTNSLKLSQIPKRLMIFAKQQYSDLTFKSSDSFARIDRIAILFNNESNLLGNMTSAELYEVSCRNGLDMSWAQWYKHRGGVLSIDFGRDIGLPSNLSPGCRGDFTIQVEVTFTNISPYVKTFELWTNYVLEGTYEIADNIARTSLGNLTPDLVLQVNQGSHYLSENHAKELKGGGFLGTLNGIVNNVAGAVSNLSGMAMPFAPLAEGFLPGASAITPAIHAGASMVKGLTGGGLSGGRMGSRSRKKRY